MPTLITNKKKRTSIEYDSDGLIIPYHRKYGITRKKKVTDPFAIPPPDLKSPKNVIHKQSIVDSTKIINETSIFLWLGTLECLCDAFFERQAFTDQHLSRFITSDKAIVRKSE